MRGINKTHLLVAVALAALVVIAPGCGKSYPVIPDSKGVSTVTYPSALGNYARVYAMTYKIVNRYSLIKWASYSQGEIVGEMMPDNSMFDKTRKIIHARIFDDGEYFDVEVRVLIEIDQSEPETFREFHPRFEWRTIASDSRLETKLNNEVKLALTDNAYLKKHHVSLAPEVEDHGAPMAPAPQGAPLPAAPGDDAATLPKVGKDEGLVRHEVSGEASYADLEALGIYYMRNGRYQLARTAFQTAVDLKEDNPYGWYLLAHSQFSTADFAGATTSIRKGLKINPEWTRSGIDFRSFYGDNVGDFAMHFGRLEETLQRNDADADARAVLGYIYFFSDRYGDALTEFDNLIAINPSDDLFDHYRRHCLVAIDKESGLEEH